MGEKLVQCQAQIVVDKTNNSVRQQDLARLAKTHVSHQDSVCDYRRMLHITQAENR